MVLLLVPVELITAMIFLYVVLRWRYLINPSQTSIPILLPIQSYLVSLKMQTITTKKMEKVSHLICHE